MKSNVQYDGYVSGCYEISSGVKQLRACPNTL